MTDSLKEMNRESTKFSKKLLNVAKDLSPSLPTAPNSNSKDFEMNWDLIKTPIEWKIAVREEKERVMQFLMELNEQYSQVRGSILMMSPPPDTQKVHGLVLQQERQMEVAIRQEIVSASHAMQTTRGPGH